jgi:hypothetical protein
MYHYSVSTAPCHLGALTPCRKMTFSEKMMNSPSVRSHRSTTCGVDLSSNPWNFLPYTVVLSLTICATFFSSGRPPRIPAPVPGPIGAEEYELGWMPAKPDRGGNPDPGPAAGTLEPGAAAWGGAFGYGFRLGYVGADWN